MASERVDCPTCGKTVTARGLGTHRRMAHGHRAVDGPHGKPGNTLPPDVRARVIELCRAKVPRNQIADQLGIARASVSGIVKRERARTGDPALTFDRAVTKAATEAKQVDSAARRAALAAGLLDDIEKLRAQLFAPAVVFNIGGKENVYTEHEVPEPPAESKLKLMQAIGAAIDRHVRLDLHDSNEHGLGAVDTWLRDMLGQ